VFFLSLFWFLCTVFVFFVPIWSSDSDLSENSQDKGNIESLADNQEINQDLIVQDSVKFSWNLRIAIKKGMLKGAISRFVDEFLEQRWGSVEFVEVSSPDEWYSLEWIDLYLIPYDVLTWLNFEEILFQEDISQLFVSQLKNFIKQHNNLIPFWIDLPIVYGLSNLSEWMDWLVRDATNWTPSRLYWPFNFWISDDLATYDNSLISSQQVIDFIEVNNVGAFSQWIDFTASSQDLQHRLLSAIQWSSDLCKEYPLSCLIEKKLLWLAWWFKSDYNQGFENEVYWKKYPYEGKSQFVRLYSFAIAKGSENYSMAIQFILDYMDNTFSDWNISISKSIWLVPVFENEFSHFCYQDSCWISNNLLFLEDGFKKIDRFYTDSVFWKVLWKKVQPNLYLLNTLL
jgi:hypothetical protein